MAPRPVTARSSSLARWAALALGVALAGGCSSSTRRDQSFGTDAGSVYQAPDGGGVTPRDSTAGDAGADGLDAATGDGAGGDGASSQGN